MDSISLGFFSFTLLLLDGMLYCYLFLELNVHLRA